MGGVGAGDCPNERWDDVKSRKTITNVNERVEFMAEQL